jgi:hypothetical protein
VSWECPVFPWTGSSGCLPRSPRHVRTTESRSPTVCSPLRWHSSFSWGKRHRRRHWLWNYMSIDNWLSGSHPETVAGDCAADERGVTSGWNESAQTRTLTTPASTAAAAAFPASMARSPGSTWSGCAAARSRGRIRAWSLTPWQRRTNARGGCARPWVTSGDSPLRTRAGACPRVTKATLRVQSWKKGRPHGIGPPGSGVMYGSG